MEKSKPFYFAGLRIACCIMFLAMFLSASGCMGNKKIGIEKGEELLMQGTTFSADQTSYPGPKNLFPEYRIVPGDLLDVLFQIRSWQDKDQFTIAVDHTISVKFVYLPELNETQNVQPDGKISLPHIGETHVVGKTIPQLTAELKSKYSKVLRDPELYVVVPEFSTQIKELKKDLHTASRGLSRLVTVRPDGYATFPLAGDVFVASLTIPEANKILDKRYEELMPGLHVDLFLEKTSGSVVYVLGEVNGAGGYPISKPISVLEAITLSGGSKPDARLDSVIVFRRQENKFMATRLNVESMLRARPGSSIFFLRPDDIVFVPRTTVADLAQLMAQVSQIVLFRGWSVTGNLFDGGLVEVRDAN